MPGIIGGAGWDRLGAPSAQAGMILDRSASACDDFARLAYRVS